MNFSSIQFIFLFLPLFVLVHALTKGKLQNLTLLFGSILFYGFAVGGHYEWIVLLLLSSVASYFIGLLIEVGKGRYRKAMLLAGVLFHLAVLCLYKYSDLWISLFSGLLEGGDSSTGVLLPLGISFYTFKNLSYLHEVYAGRVVAEKSFIDFSAYLMMFPQISMGPIQTYESFQPYLHDRKVTLSGINSGVTEFILGLGLKTIFANRLGSVFSGIETIGYDGISTPLAWLGVISYSLQLYFDFYGYSLMASGIGEMLGYQTPKNFDYPYTATSMTDFWRRWHMTLGTWFKENVYFPLGGSRCSTVKHYRNLFVVWVLTGVWHGNTVTFLLWGLFLFAVIAIEKSGVLNKVIQHKFWSHVYMIPLILLSWTIFRLPTFGDLGVYVTRLFPFFGETPEYVSPTDWVKYAKGVGGLMVAGILFSTPLPRKLFEKIRNKPLVSVPILLVIFWYAVYLAACGANDPFLYFNF
ncbi:MAG: MBOAT family protein [Ruminococcaceae bacterium]|nr:MBOAT family protein [Oscillospiraceae bacterium]